MKRLGYRLEQVIVVDDTARNHEQNYGNPMRMREWYGCLDDDELLHLERYLSLLEQEPNVRAIEKRFWRSLVVE